MKKEIVAELVTPERGKKIDAFMAELADLCRKHRVHLQASDDQISLIEVDKQMPDGWPSSAFISEVGPDVVDFEIQWTWGPDSDDEAASYAELAGDIERDEK